MKLGQLDQGNSISRFRSATDQGLAIEAKLTPSWRNTFLSRRFPADRDCKLYTTEDLM
jgi:hypothetical protein